jgi:hypothetical protein
MKLPFLSVALVMAALFVAQSSQAQNAFTPDQVKFGPAPAFCRRVRSWLCWRETQWARPATLPFA